MRKSRTADRFARGTTNLREQAAALESITGRKGSDAALLYRYAEQLESFVAEPNTIANRLTNFKENLSALAAWILSARSQPLELDYLYIASPDVEAPKAGCRLFRQSMA